MAGIATDDGYPQMALADKWSVVDKPSGANVKIADNDKLITGVSVDKAGKYAFKLNVSNGELESSDTFTVNVLDESQAKNNAKLVGNVSLSDGKTGKAVSMNGSISRYVKLTNTLTKRVKDFTVDADVKLNGIQGDGARIFEFGDMNKNYLYI
ncbi:hypothetical protein KYB31_08400 [Clostridium felsineum]|uniref:hypothetical protein n=1 Tax=Clostridium felsineum TaxID=36839 RepID=UPI00214D2E50|nr:hypothetical protein [Clostridium felsineum]MCR3759008.1 hypothetical protein [Clostridium felsineum]